MLPPSLKQRVCYENVPGSCASWLRFLWESDSVTWWSKRRRQFYILYLEQSRSSRPSAWPSANDKANGRNSEQKLRGSHARLPALKEDKERAQRPASAHMYPLAYPVRLLESDKGGQISRCPRRQVIHAKKACADTRCGEDRL